MFDKYIRDNVHGDIHIKDPIIKEIIDAPEFQRLRRITQLGGGQFVFPGANHTRFSHCIGVYHIVGKIVSNPKVAKHLTEIEILEAELSGLLHDIGHGPFSHSFEHLSKRAHELYTVDFIVQDTNINKILKKHNISPERIASIIQGKHPNKLLNLLISSQIDADRLDYLLRDSHSTGVDYANLELDWMIRNADVIDNKLVFKDKTLNAIEHYLLGRYHMFNQIYNHKTSIAFDRTYKFWFKRLSDLYQQNFEFKNKRITELFIDFFDNKTCELVRYQQLDDYTMIEIIKSCVNEDDKILSDLAERIITRKFLKVSKSMDKNQWEKLKNLQNIEKQNYYFDTITKSTFNIYNEKTTKKDEGIYILHKNRVKDISELSAILKIAPKEGDIFVYIKE